MTGNAGLCLAVISAAGGRYTSACRASKCDVVAGIFTLLTSPCAGISLYATVCRFLPPLRDANQIAAFRHSRQVGFAIGVLAEQ